MPRSNKTLRSQDVKTIAWFESEIQNATPQQGVLDTVSLGVWGVAEQSGILAGEWRRHRNFMIELDTVKVTATLGALLEAITQTAQAIGISLEAIMEQQVEQVQQRRTAVARQNKVATPRKSQAAKATAAPDLQSSSRTVTPASPPPDATTENRRRGRPRKSSVAADVTIAASPVAPASFPLGDRRRQPRHQDDAVLPIASVIPKQRRRKRDVSLTQPTLLSETAPSSMTTSRHKARAEAR